MTKAHVLAGGDSSERAVSLRSGAAVAAALKNAGYEVTILDPCSVTFNQIIDCDAVFPVLHGAGGEDGSLQAKLEASEVRFVGSGAKASALCFDKWNYRQKMETCNVLVAPGALVQADNYLRCPLARTPFVLKPTDGGSSIDTFIVRNLEDIPATAISDSFTRYPTMLMEQLIVGTELTVGVLGNNSLPVIEIIPPKNSEFDYEHKYDGSTQELCPPPHVSPSVQKRAQALALQAHLFTGCRDLSRTDIMYENASDTLYLLETNTMPGMTAQSLFPKMAASSGVSMTQLVQQLVKAALSR